MSLEFGVRGTAVRASILAGYIPWHTTGKLRTDGEERTNNIPT